MAERRYDVRIEMASTLVSLLLINPLIIIFYISNRDSNLTTGNVLLDDLIIFILFVLVPIYLPRIIGNLYNYRYQNKPHYIAKNTPPFLRSPYLLKSILIVFGNFMVLLINSIIHVFNYFVFLGLSTFIILLSLYLNPLNKSASSLTNLKNETPSDVFRERIDYITKKLELHNLKYTKIQIFKSPIPQAVVYRSKKRLTLSSSLVNSDNNFMFETVIHHEIGHLKNPKILSLYHILLLIISLFIGIFFGLSRFIQLIITGLEGSLFAFYLKSDLFTSLASYFFLFIIPFFLTRRLIWLYEIKAEQFALNALGENIWRKGREIEIKNIDNLPKFNDILQLSQMYPISSNLTKKLINK